MLARNKNSSLLAPLARYEENKVLWIRPQIFGGFTKMFWPLKINENSWHFLLLIFGVNTNINFSYVDQFFVRPKLCHSINCRGCGVHKNRSKPSFVPQTPHFAHRDLRMSTTVSMILHRLCTLADSRGLEIRKKYSARSQEDASQSERSILTARPIFDQWERSLAEFRRT